MVGEDGCFLGTMKRVGGRVSGVHGDNVGIGLKTLGFCRVEGSLAQFR